MARELVGREGADMASDERRELKAGIRANNIVIQYVKNYKRSCENCEFYFK